MAETQPKPPLKESGIAWLKKQHARHFVISRAEHAVLDLPLTIFVIAALMAPHLAILGLILALVTRHEVTVTNPDQAEAEPPAHEPLPGGEFPVGEEAADSNDGDQTWPA